LVEDEARARIDNAADTVVEVAMLLEIALFDSPNVLSIIDYYASRASKRVKNGI
jgi:hypothetical protein